MVSHREKGSRKTYVEKSPDGGKPFYLLQESVLKDLKVEIQNCFTSAACEMLLLKGERRRTKRLNYCKPCMSVILELKAYFVVG